MKGLLVPTREKLVVMFYFLIVVLLVFILHSALSRILLNGRNPQEGEYIIKSIFPMMDILFTFSQYYLFTCVAVLVIKKSK